MTNLHYNIRLRLLGLGWGFGAGILTAMMTGHFFAAILFTEWICLTIGYAVSVMVAVAKRKSERARVQREAIRAAYLAGLAQGATVIPTNLAN